MLGELNTALLAKLAAGKLLRCRKLRVDTTVIQADIDHPTDADLLEHAVCTLGGLARRIRERGAATRMAYRNRSRAAGRRLKQIAHRANARRDRPTHRRGRHHRPPDPGPNRTNRPQRPPRACQPAR